MLGCKVEPVNAIDFVNGSYNVPFLPFSISTLKILLTNSTRENIKVILCPKESQNDDQYCCGFDDEKKGLRFTWGGGNENGSQVSLSKGQSKYAFIFVHHENSIINTNYNLTLNIKKIMGISDNAIEDDTIHIRFFPIENKKEIIHSKTRNSDNGLTRITFEGNLSGYYYPRWYPELLQYTKNSHQNEYYYREPEIPDIEILLERKNDNYDNDRIVINFGASKRTIGLISGDMDGASFWSDIFRFSSNTFVLRLWVYWLSKNQFRKGVNLKIKEEPDRGLTKPELPDLERYDFLIADSGKVLVVGTDFHWREYWYETNNKDLVQGQIKKYWHPPFETISMLIGRKSNVDYKDIIQRLFDYISKQPKHEAKYNDTLTGLSIEERINNSNSKIEREINGVPKRWKNIFRSHVPYIKNGYIRYDMVSKEVDNI